jgi:ribosome recycling factor
MASEFDIAELKRRMQGAISVLGTELNGLRTGRASPSLLDPINVDAYGSHMPLNQVASITVPEPRMLNVQVWDRGMTGAVERAIRESNLGLNPIIEGQLLRIPIPELNAERRKELVKVGHKYAEQAKVAVRNVRRDGLDVLKKMEKDGDISEDDVRRQSDVVQKATDEAISEIDTLMAAKEKEITQV